MQEDRIPKIFISYSWSSDALVLPLAQRLVNHGVEVVLDKWDLKEGQDKYAFMEQCVTDPDITKVLIICDKSYMEKANARKGGVGDETVIISGEVYGKMQQEKFIPIIAERDDEGNAFVPAYIKTRIYIDLSNEATFEQEYEKLLRNIYNKPLHSKPKLGKRPEWLDEENTNLFPLTDLVRQIRGASALKKAQSCTNQFIEKYLETLKSYYIQNPSAEQVYNRFVEMKAIRDVFLDFLPALAETDLSFSEVICGAFEKLYNNLTCDRLFNPKVTSTESHDFEIYLIHLWELFVCVITYLRHYGEYKTIHEIVGNTYFLVRSRADATIKAANYCIFRHHSRAIEDYYKPTTDKANLFTLMGNTVCCEREKLPIYSGVAFAQADLFLYQIRNGLDIVEDDVRYRADYWFPTCYVYAAAGPDEWEKLRSRKFCTKMLDLFGADSMQALKEAISKCKSDRDMGYRGSFESAPAILNYIKVDDIGSVS